MKYQFFDFVIYRNESRFWWGKKGAQKSADEIGKEELVDEHKVVQEVSNSLGVNGGVVGDVCSVRVEAVESCSECA